MQVANKGAKIDEGSTNGHASNSRIAFPATGNPKQLPYGRRPFAGTTRRLLGYRRGLVRNASFCVSILPPARHCACKPCGGKRQNLPRRRGGGLQRQPLISLQARRAALQSALRSTRPPAQILPISSAGRLPDGADHFTVQAEGGSEACSDQSREDERTSCSG